MPEQNNDALDSYVSLTGFQRDLLWIVSQEDEYGLGINEKLDVIHPDTNHGRLYPNLDALVEAGLVEKSVIDRRTNNYSITEAGRHALSARQAWQEDHVHDQVCSVN